MIQLSAIGRRVLLCAFLLASASPALGQAPVNDLCANSIVIGDGDTAFSTLNSTTDGPTHAGCQFGGATYNDIWYRYTASCTGELTVSTCGLANYDTDLVLYNGCNCAALATTMLACNEDGAGCPGFTSTLTAPVTAGNCYLIRVGGFSTGSRGTGTIRITCVDLETTPGGCCHPDDSCTQDTMSDCTAMGGEFYGFNQPCSPNPCDQPNGADVVYSNVTSITNWGQIDGMRAYSLSSSTCNMGTGNLPWGSTSPLLAMNAYRLHGGRIEQIGLGWVKNGTGAAAGSGCGWPCNGQGGSSLGSGCQDVYGSGFNGGWGVLGPRSAVNAYTGAYPGPSGTGVDLRSKRLQVRESDLSTTNYPGARYLVEGVYVAALDAASGNALNNASYKFVTVDGSFNMAPTGTMYATIPAIFAWKDHGLGLGQPDPDVQIATVDIPGEGRFFIGSKATAIANGRWRYDYAVYNLNSHRSAASLSVPLMPGADVRNTSFHDVDYHSGEPYSNADWVVSLNSSQVKWSSPQTYEQNQNTNALRWGTMYSFWFDSANAPTERSAVIGLFRPGTPTTGSASVVVPGPCKGDCFVDGRRDARDVQNFAACLIGTGTDCGCADVDGAGGAGMGDIAGFVGLLLQGADCP